jgi:hypothetical protein
MAFSSKYSRGPGDSILAMLEPGEYVLNRNAVEEVGKDNLDDLNYDDAPRFDMSQRGQFQVGGMFGEMIGMQGGGSTLEYGGATTEEPTLAELYERMGMQPNVTRRPGFEEQWAYDPSREGVIFEDYGRAVQGATQAGRQNLMGAGQKMQQTQAKAGFAGAGAGAQAVSEQRGTIMQDFLAQEAAAKSSLFKGVRGERETWMTEAGGALGILSGQEGTVDLGVAADTESGGTSNQDSETYSQIAAPTSPGTTTGQVSGSGEWTWNGSSWVPSYLYESSGGGTTPDKSSYSDIRLKKDINYIFTMDNDVPIYTFKYKWSDDINIGTMAQDIEGMIPESVSHDSNGYKMVNYSKVFNYGKV